MLDNVTKACYTRAVTSVLIASDNASQFCYKIFKVFLQIFKEKASELAGWY